MLWRGGGTHNKKDRGWEGEEAGGAKILFALPTSLKEGEATKERTGIKTGLLKSFGPSLLFGRNELVAKGIEDEEKGGKETIRGERPNNSMIRVPRGGGGVWWGGGVGGVWCEGRQGDCKEEKTACGGTGVRGYEPARSIELFLNSRKRQSLTKGEKESITREKHTKEHMLER